MSATIGLHETAEHQALREQVRRFARTEVAPFAHAWDEAGEFPRELYGKAAAGGPHRHRLPRGLRRQRRRPLARPRRRRRADHRRHLGRARRRASAATASRCRPSSRWAPRRRSSASSRPCSAASTSRRSPSPSPAAAATSPPLTTRAVRDGDHYVVTGAKMFITSGCRADFVTTAVRTGGPGHGGISLLVIERGTPGFTVSKKLEKMGWWASDTAELVFDGCRVPVANLLGARERRLRPHHDELRGRAALPRRAVRRHRRARLPRVHRATRASARRSASRITGFQVIRHKLADMATRLAAARALTNEVLLRGAARRAGPRPGGDGEEHRDGHVRVRGRPGGADPRRLRLHARVRGRAALPRRAPLPDRRRHARDHERDHLARPRVTDGALPRCLLLPDRRRSRSAPATRPASPRARVGPPPASTAAAAPARPAGPRTDGPTPRPPRSPGTRRRRGPRPTTRARCARRRTPSPAPRATPRTASSASRRRAAASIRTSPAGPGSSTASSTDVKRTGAHGLRPQGHGGRDPRRVHRAWRCPGAPCPRPSRGMLCSGRSSGTSPPTFFKLTGPGEDRRGCAARLRSSSWAACARNRGLPGGPPR